MELMGGQAVQRLGDRLVGELKNFGEGFPLDKLGCHRTGRDGRAAAKGLKFHIRDNAVLNFEINLHNVPADGVAHLAHTVRILDHTHVPGIPKVIHYLFTVKCHNKILLQNECPFPADFILPQRRHIAQIGHDFRDGFQNRVDIGLGVLLAQ